MLQQHCLVDILELSADFMSEMGWFLDRGNEQRISITQWEVHSSNNIFQKR